MSFREIGVTSRTGRGSAEHDAFEAVVSQSVDGLMVIDEQGIVQFANPAANALFAGKTTDLVGFHFGVPAHHEPVELLLPRGKETLHVEMRSNTIQWDGRPATLASLRDLTAQKRIQEALRERVKELRCLFELSRIVEQKDASIEQILEQTVHLMPPAWQFTESAVARIRFHDLVFQTGDLDACLCRISTELYCDEDAVGSIEVGYLAEQPPAAEGPFLLEERELLTMLAERLGHVIGRKRSEDALRESEKKYRLLADNTLDVIWAMNLELEFTYVNPAIIRLTGHTPEEYVGTRLADHLTETAFAEVAGVIGREAARGAGREGLIYETELLRKDGSPIPVEVHGRVIVDETGAPIGFHGTTRDIGDRKRAEAERERLLLSIEQTAEAIIISDIDGTIQYVNPAFEQITGYSREEVLGKNPRILKSGEHDPAFYRRLWDTLVRGETWHGRIVNRRKDGTLYTEEGTISPVRGSDGILVNYVSSMRDITHGIELEHQLRQAQKMESVGRLAGGVAHDFNNMLTIILGNAQMALEDVPPSDPLHGELEEIVKASQRSADLTRQLLAFARKQTIEPKVLDLNDTIAGMLKMLGRLIGEDIQLVWKPAANLPLVKMDPGQIDQILANLLVNARDAIDGVGNIFIETGNVELDAEFCSRHPGAVPGDFVMLVVSDDGSGVDAETVDRIFEPFFTTKSKGRGTGLGLATVYGIVKQNAGYISVYSEPGEGSTFRIYVPRLEESETQPEDAHEVFELEKGTEAILLVEDEMPLLDLTKRFMQKLGYTVLAAGTPGDALKLAKDQTEHIDLLVTDVVMPEMSGRDLWREISEVRPGLKCLFMSGYTANAIAHRGVLEKGVHFLAKPFTLRSLAAGLREALED